MPSTRRKNKRDYSATAASSSSTSPTSSKRKSKSAKSKTSKRSTDSKSKAVTANADKSCLLVTLLNQLDTLAQSKQTSVAAVQTISKATILHSKTTNTNTNNNHTNTNNSNNANNHTNLAASILTQKKQNASGTYESQCNANLIIVATHILNRIMTHLNSLQSNGNGNDNGNNTHEHRQFAIVLSIYAATLTKILLSDKAQLERTINAASSRTGGGGGASALGGADRKHPQEEGWNAKSLLGRAILSSMLSTLKSMHLLSSSNLLLSTDKIYARLMWKNAIVLERLLALGPNYRSIKANNKTGKITSVVQSSVLSSLGGVTAGTGISGISNGFISSGSIAGALNSVHNVNMDLGRANAWNEICTAMESEEGSKASSSSPPLLSNSTLIEALTNANQNLFHPSDDNDNDNSNNTTNNNTEEDIILQLITFENDTQTDNDESEKKDENDSKSSAKRRKTESSIPTAKATTAARTRARALSDKNQKDSMSSEFATLSAQASEVIFSFEFNKSVLGGNRLTLKKWSSPAFAWVCNGQEIGLETVRNMLMKMDIDADMDRDMDDESENNENGTKWDQIMQLSTVITTSTSSPRKKGNKTSPSERKRSGITNAKNKGSVINIPGDLVLITYASRLIDIINEAGKTAGSSLQRNGTEEYVNLFNISTRSGSDPTAIASHPSPKTSGSNTKSRRQSARKTRDNTSVATSPSSSDVKADVVMSSSNKTKPNSGSSKMDEHKRTDIRNLVILVMKSLLVAHQSCLQKNVARPADQANTLAESIEMMDFSPKFPLKDGEVLRQILLNQDDNTMDGGISNIALDHNKDLLEACRYFPQMHKTIDTLIKCALSVALSIGGIENCAPCLTGIGAALAIKYSTVVNKSTKKELKQQKKSRIVDQNDNPNTIVVIDAKLCSWSVYHLSMTVGNIIALSKQPFQEEDVAPPAHELTPDLVQRYSLLQPIVLRNQLDKNSTDEYLDLFESGTNSEEVNSAQDEQGQQKCLFGGTLALFFRVMLSEKEEEGKGSPTRTMLKLVESLMRIISCCYSIEAKSNRSTNPRRSTFTRFTLASDCIDALRKCLSFVPSSKVDNKITELSVLMRSLIRQYSLTPEIVCCFVELGDVLEQNIIRQRVEVFGEADDIDCNSEKPPSLSPNQNPFRLEFEQWERRLWSSHVKLCLVIGRGHAGFLGPSSQKQTQSYLGSYSNKLTIFRAVMNVYNSPDPSRLHWPLCLSSIHHALITTSLISDPLPRTMKDAAAEKFICDQLIQSISDALTNPTIILDQARLQKRSNIQVSDEEIPLSLRDSRLFVLALCRLPKKDQNKRLSKLISLLSTGMQKINEDDDLRKLVITEKDYSGFLGRIVTVISILIDMISGGKSLLDSLRDHMGPLHYYLPSIIEVDSDTDLDGSDWYRKESCFMGLWEEWESSASPPADTSTYSDPLPNDELSKFQLALQIAMEFGFDSASEDKCLLLFAAWNASGKLFNEKWEEPSTLENLSKIPVPLKLFRIRNDVCNLYQELNGNEKSMPDTLLSKQMRSKEQRHDNRATSSNASKGILHLRCALSSNLDMLKDLSNTSVNPNNNISPSSGDFAMFETTVAYTSFLISMFTTTGTEFLSAIIPRDKTQEDRKRKGSSISADSYDDDISEDSAESENDFDDDHDDAKSDGISRFHEICEELGAAPIHPDWLDTNCRFRTGITKSATVETAELALRVLTDFGAKIYDCYIQSLKSVLCFENATGSEIGSPFNIINGMLHGVASTGWHQAVGDLYNLDTNVVALFEAGLPCKNISAVKEAWAPNSAHHILGKLQNTMSINGWAVSSAELRAGAEWEILLSDALLGACSDIDYGSCNLEMRKKFHEILRWRRVLHSTISAIVTSTALLRFSLNDGKGRTRHHLNNLDSNQENKDKWYQSSPIYRFPSYEDFSALGVSSGQLDSSICKSLSFLSDIQSSGALSVDCQLSAQAATCHLVGSDNDMQLLVDVKKMKNLLLGLKALFDFVKGKEAGTFLQSSTSVVDKIVLSEQVVSDGKFSEAMLFSLGSPIEFSITTLHNSNHELKSILCCDFEKSLTHITPWQWGLEQRESVSILVQIVQGRCPIELSGSARLKIIQTVKEILITEEKFSREENGVIKQMFLKYWNEAKEDDLDELVLRDICLRDVNVLNLDDKSTQVPLEISRNLSSTIAYLSGVKNESGDNLKANKVIFKILRSHMKSWMMNESLDHVLCLLYLLSACHGAIGEVGTDLLRYLDGEHSNDRGLIVLEMFYRFLCDSKKRLKGGIDHVIEDIDAEKDIAQIFQNKSDKSSFVTKLGEVKQRCCTYVTTQGNFSEQHWYNCYTCGLLWDKGCCSLCAQVCHKGHDVGYSRKSSFFCDCGADVGTDCERGPCKCLSPLSDIALSSVYDVRLNSTYKLSNNDRQEDIGSVDINSKVLSFWKEATKVSASNFPSIFISSLDEFTESIKSKTVEKLFGVFNTHFEAWAEKDSMNSMLPTDIDRNAYDEQHVLRNQRPSLVSRSGRQVEVNPLDEKKFSVVRAFKSATINAKISNETNTDRRKKTIISKNSIERNVIVVDKRGRIIISEAGSLLFCAGLSLSNVRHQIMAFSTQLQRSELCVLGSSKVKCNIVGLALSPDLDSRLLAWGTSDAYVFIISDSCDGVESVIELEVGLDLYDCETDYIVKAEWLPGSSGNILVVFCATSVKIFDIRRATTCSGNDDNDFSCQAASSYALAYEDVVIKGGIIIPSSNESSSELIDSDSSSKIAILFDTGRLQFIEVNLDRDEGIVDKGEFNIGYGEGLSFPVAGIKRCGSSVEPPGSMAKSLGEGTHLQYLYQSELLLYKCSSSPMIAFILDKSGCIIGSFEFLPYILNREMFGSTVNGHSLTGPYTHWKELGIVQRDGSNFYRASFVARSTKMNQPKMVYMEFNEDSTRVTEVKTPTNSLTLALNSSVEGTAAFSAPNLPDSGNGMIVDKSTSFCERIFLVSVSSNGNILLFREEMDKNIKDYGNTTHDIVRSGVPKRRRAFSDSILSHNKKEIDSTTTSILKDDVPRTAVQLPTFPLTIFEELINMSEKPELIFGGNCVKDPDVTKKRLSASNGEFIISPCKNGCTLTVSLRSPDRSNKTDCMIPNVFKERLPTPHEKSEAKTDGVIEVNKLVIVAVRILLGSTTTEYLPKEIAVMGRQIKLTQRMKRWYNIPLSDEEIMLSLRSGVVTISVGASYETTKSPPLIDSVQVYAQERSKLPHLFPIHTDNDPSFDEIGMTTTSEFPSEEDNRKPLNTSILAITHMCNLLGNKVDLSSQISLQTLKRLIQVTALDSPKEGTVRNHVINLVKSVEKNPHTMQMLLDEGTLQGVSNTLKDFCLKKSDSSSIAHHCRDKVLTKIKDCLHVTLLIAKDRPLNYRTSIDKLIASGQIKCSIALQAKRILDVFTNRTFAIKTTSKLIQLAIFEAMATEGSPIENFAGLQLVSEILHCRDESVVKESCIKLAETLKEMQAFDKVQAYQCDGCTAFPITGTRYTLEDKNIDLCKKCFECGNKYARSRAFQSGAPVLVNGRKLKMGGDKVMSCSQIYEMTTKLVPSNILEQVREANALREDHAVMDEADDEDDVALKIALKMSLETQLEDSVDSELHRTSSYIIHMNVITKLLQDIEQSLSTHKESVIHHPIPVIDLLLTLVVQCDSPEDQLTFGKKICDVLCCNMFTLIESYCCKHPTQGTLKNTRVALLIYLRALEGLATKQESILSMMNTAGDQKQPEVPTKEAPPVTERTKDKTDPRFVCETHRVPAVRRRCSHGENKDRRFYVCGMDRKNRCKYFKWADEKDATNNMRGLTTGACTSKLSVTSVGLSSDDLSAKTDPELQSLLWNILNDKKQPLQQRLCSLLQTFLKKLTSQGDESTNMGKAVPDDKISKLRNMLEKNKTRDQNRAKELDGVHLPVGIFHRHGELDNQLGSITKSSQISASEYSVVEASLDLLSKVAMNALKGSQNPQKSSWEGWFALLCEIISSSSSSHLRRQAKKMMKRLCGGHGVIYHQIRDQYVFGFQFMKLLHHCEAPLQAALDVREKARRCGSQWRLTDLTWATLPIGGLIGTQELISEDNYGVQKMENVSKNLDDLINTARTRGNNWSHFCALDKMPQKNRDDIYIRDRSPICLLLWMACSLPPQNQVKVLKLMQIALSLPCEKEQIMSSSSVGEDSVGIMSTDGGTDFEASPSGKQNYLCSDKESPQQVLLGGASGLTIDDIHAFIISFILNGENTEIRTLASNVCLKILPSTPTSWIEALLKRFISILVSDVGYLGCEAVEFLQFLYLLVSNDQIMTNIDVSILFQAAATFFTKQLKASRNAKLSSGKEATLIELSSSLHNEQVRVFDFASCVHCQKLHSRSRTSMAKNLSNENSLCKSARVTDEITKRRLDNYTLGTVSSEFSCHVQLKCRMTITEVHLNVSDPRGRFVKTIGIFFSPRPVRNVNELTKSEYEPFWQRCGTLTLPRGGNRVSCKLTYPIVAANLRFEYDEFYEKISGSRPSGSGTIVIHCPRCTRVVNNAHGGVCGNCGEVAFQCRKCRHINYDRLDAFLCVECGYCSSGSFSYEISSSPASRAVAIIDDEGLERAVRLMWVAGNKYNEYKGALMKILQNSKLLTGRKRNRGDVHASFNKLNGPLKRALLGDLPKVNFKSNSVSGGRKKRLIASENLDSTIHAESSSGSAAVNRAKSLLNLAIQLRGESAHEDSASLGDVPDSLSRLVANIARARNGNSINRRNKDEDNEDKRDSTGDGSDAEAFNPNPKTEESSKKILQNCEKLYQQMREAEKDNFEFRTRVIGWKRLNHGALANHGREAHLMNCTYSVNYCSSCSPAILKPLLALVHVSFREKDATLSDSALSKDFISLLFDEGHDNDNADLNRLKRAMIVALATKSTLGSDMVFDELQMRLRGSKSVTCADILGELLAENDVKSPGKFVELAMRTLN